jgi:gamma-glutamylcyclotransferase (GGCT)/AIG2-like uncharacterized protein YtfP
MHNEIYHLFVYGSLRSGFRSEAYAYLSRYFTFVAEGVVKGALYNKGSVPVAVPTEENKFITGELYRLNNTAEFDWVMDQIDDYEGLHVETGEKPLYTRALADVIIGDNKTKAWIYWYDGSVAGFPELEVNDIPTYLQQRNKH